MGVEEVVMSENESAFEITTRRGIIVWVYSLRQLKSLKRFGLVHYISKKSKYVCLYVNEEKVEEVIKKIEKLHFVRHVEPSYRPDIEMNFAERIGTKKAYQVDDDGYEVEELNTTIRLADEVF